jgi:hypothetical protein
MRKENVLTAKTKVKTKKEMKSVRRVQVDVLSPL